MRTEILPIVGGHAHDVTGAAYGRHRRVEHDSFGAQLRRDRLRQPRVAARDAHRLGSRCGDPRHRRNLLRNEKHRQVGELRVVERGVRLLHHEAGLGAQLQRIQPSGEAERVERLGAVGRLGLLGVDVVRLDEPHQLVVDAPAVGEHRAVTLRHELGHGGAAPSIQVAAPAPAVAGTSRTALGRDAEARQELPDRGVVLVDRFAARLGVQPAVQRDAVVAAVQREHAPTDARARLEHDHVPPAVPEVQRRGQAGEARTHDDHPADRVGVGARRDFCACHAKA